MKKIIFTTLLLLMTSSIQAEQRLTGTINKIDIETGQIVIDNINYQMNLGNFGGNSGIKYNDVKNLKRGSKVNFVSNISFITKIKLK